MTHTHTCPHTHTHVRVWNSTHLDDWCIPHICRCEVRVILMSREVRDGWMIHGVRGILITRGVDEIIFALEFVMFWGLCHILRLLVSSWCWRCGTRTYHDVCTYIMCTHVLWRCGTHTYQYVYHMCTHITMWIICAHMFSLNICNTWTHILCEDVAYAHINLCDVHNEYAWHTNNTHTQCATKETYISSPFYEWVLRHVFHYLSMRESYISRHACARHVFHHFSMSNSSDMYFITFLCVSVFHHLSMSESSDMYFITFLWVRPQTCISSSFYEWGLRHVFHHLSMSESSDMYFIIFLWVSPVYHVTHLFPQSHASDQLFCTAAPYERTHSVSCEEPPRISAAVIRTPIQSLIKGEPPFSPFLRGSTNFSSPLSEDLFVSCWRCSTAPYERTHRVPFEEPPRTSAAFMIRLIESLFKGLHKC